METGAIILLDRDRAFASHVAALLRRKHPEATIRALSSAREALEILRTEDVWVLVADERLTDDGRQLLEQALAAEPDLAVILLTDEASLEKAVRALRSGAYDFLARPVADGALLNSVGNALERGRLLEENRRLKRRLSRAQGEQLLVGESPAMRRLRAAVKAVADADYGVLIRGESGAGKEVVARAIHRQSRRKSGPFVAVNCPAIPEQLLESELFGHVKGAFTGADRERKGLLLEAQGGTILLDEIGDISLATQAKLLRCLQERELRPVGGEQSVRFDTRILASTNRNLEVRLADGAFREDLFHRLNVLTILVPPLRDRREDIPLLAQSLLSAACRELGLPAKEIAPDVLGYLATRQWPGNVREMQNVMRRLAVFTEGDTVTMRVVRQVETGKALDGEEPGRLAPYKEAKERMLRDFASAYLRQLLAASRGNVSAAARESGLSRFALQELIKKSGIRPSRYR